MAASDIETQMEIDKKDHPFTPKKEDARKFIICGVHEGSSKINFQTEKYVMKKRHFDGVAIIDIANTWDKLFLAARIIASVENWSDVCVVSNNPIAQRALLKFAAHTGSSSIVGRFTPGLLTNQSQKNFKEPRLIVVSDPQTDSQAVLEASHVNVPVIALCNTDSSIKNVDVVIPCNNKSPHSIGLIYWMLAREVLHLRGRIDKSKGFSFKPKEEGNEIVPDLYFHREPQEIAIEEEAEEKPQIDKTTPAPLEPADAEKSAWGEEDMDADPVLEVVGERVEREQAPPEERGLNLRMERIVDWAAASKPTGTGNQDEEKK